MSISQNFPSSRPSLNLNFARSKKLDPRITFTRTSTATYVDEDGLVKSVATDTPRFEHNPSTGESLGLLIEESRTNLIIQSEAFNTGWLLAGATVGVNSTTAPDGTSNADAALEDGTNGQHTIYRDVTTSPSSTYTASCFIKAGTRTYGEIFINGGGAAGSGTVGGRFDLTNLTVTSTGDLTLQSSSITSYPNGWYRCSITGSVGGSGSVVRYHVRPSTSSTSSYQGVNGDAGIYMWGAQVEAGSFATSYIPTVASTVTRSTDYASITGTNFSGFYNPSEGTMYCNANNISGTGSQNRLFYQFVNSSSENTDFIRQWIWTGNTNLLLNSVYTSGSLIVDFSTTLTTNFKKTSFAYKVNDFAVSYDGSSPSTDTSGNLPSGINRLIIGNNSVVGGTALSGYISQLIYYPVRLPNAQLQNLTK